jgi:hypothetical protein
MSDVVGYENVVEVERSRENRGAPTEVTGRVEPFPMMIDEG